MQMPTGGNVAGKASNVLHSFAVMPEFVYCDMKTSVEVGPSQISWPNSS